MLHMRCRLGAPPWSGMKKTGGESGTPVKPFQGAGAGGTGVEAAQHFGRKLGAGGYGLVHGHAGAELGGICGPHYMPYVCSRVPEQGARCFLKSGTQLRVFHIVVGFRRGAQAVGKGLFAAGEFAWCGEDIPHPVGELAAGGQFTQGPGVGSACILGVDEALQVGFCHVVLCVRAGGCREQALQSRVED